MLPSYQTTNPGNTEQIHKGQARLTHDSMRISSTTSKMEFSFTHPPFLPPPPQRTAPRADPSCRTQVKGLLHCGWANNSLVPQVSCFLRYQVIFIPTININFLALSLGLQCSSELRHNSFTKRTVGGQSVNEKLLNITSHRGKAN